MGLSPVNSDDHDVFLACCAPLILEQMQKCSDITYGESVQTGEAVSGSIQPEIG
jgi:ERCC4-related helicase